MREKIEIGAVPCNEECQQLGTSNYDATRARLECCAFRDQLRRVFGEEPGTASLRVIPSAHDFGVYYEVVCCFNDDDQVAAEYAYKIEGNAPMDWDDEARRELGLEVAA